MKGFDETDETGRTGLKVFRGQHPAGQLILDDVVHLLVQLISALMSSSGIFRCCRAALVTSESIKERITRSAKADRVVGSSGRREDLTLQLFILSANFH